VIPLGEYETNLRLFVLRMKTDVTGILAISAAKVLAAARRTDLEEVQADYIVPVPMHRLRREDRGVNSPDTIAEELGLQLKIPVARHLVRRVRPTDLQYTLSRQARAKNVSGAFALRSPNLWEKIGFRHYLADTPLRSKNILLVDDILTTGATCNEMTKVLLAAGVRSVTVAVLARAEGNVYRRSTG
jgi:ComF family protein